MKATETAPGDTAPSPMADNATLDALKRIKLAETEWEGKIAAARRDAETATKRIKEESEAVLASARAQAEAERVQTLDKARTDADREASRIVAEGEQAARAATEGAGKNVTARRDEILAVVLGGFRED